MFTKFQLTQGDSKFYVLMNNGVLSRETGGSHWLTYLPGYMYCFVPSYEAVKGTVTVYDYLPDFLLDFQFCAKIQDVNFDLSGGKNYQQGALGDGNKSNQGKGNSNYKANQEAMDGNKSDYGGIDGSKLNQELIDGNKSKQGVVGFNKSNHGGRNVSNSANQKMANGSISQNGVGQGASPGKQGGQKLRDLNQAGSTVNRKYNNTRSELKLNDFLLFALEKISPFGKNFTQREICNGNEANQGQKSDDRSSLRKRGSANMSVNGSMGYDNKFNHGGNMSNHEGMSKTRKPNNRNMNNGNKINQGGWRLNHLDFNLYSLLFMNEIKDENRAEDEVIKEESEKVVMTNEFKKKSRRCRKKGILSGMEKSINNCSIKKEIFNETENKDNSDSVCNTDKSTVVPAQNHSPNSLSMSMCMTLLTLQDA